MTSVDMATSIFFICVALVLIVRCLASRIAPVLERPMREWCGCGAAIAADRDEVLRWRAKHRHEPQIDASLQVPPTGASSVVQPSWQPIGFRPNTC